MIPFLNQVCPVQMTDVGNDHCDAAANIAECEYDEGDCCPRKDNGCDDCLCYKPFNKTGTVTSQNIVNLHSVPSYKKGC